MKEKINALIDERAQIWDRMKELAFADEDGLRAEDTEAYNTAEGELDAVTEKIEEAQRQMERFETEEARNYEKFEALQQVPAGIIDAPQSLEETEDRTKKYEEAYEAYLRHGVAKVTDEQREMLEAEFRALTTTVGATGGFTVPEGFWNTLQEARLAFGGILNAGVTKISTGEGNDIPVPTTDDTGNVGELIGENTQVAEQDNAFGSVTLKAWTWSSKMVKVPVQLLQDSAFDIPGLLARQLGERLGRVQAGYYITGTGTGQPEGILTNIASTVTAGSATALAYDDFVALEHAIDPAYRNQAEYILSDDAVRASRLIKDANELPMWAPGLTVGDTGPTINGFKYTVDVNMPAVASTTQPVIFGDVGQYWVRDVLGVQMLRLDERFADYLQVAFLAYMRNDARVVNAGGGASLEALTMNT